MADGSSIQNSRRIYVRPRTRPHISGGRRWQSCRQPVGLFIPRWYIRPKTVTHPSTNRARRALTVMPNTHRPPDSTRQCCLCRVWCGGVNRTIALNVFRLQIFSRRQSLVPHHHHHFICPIIQQYAHIYINIVEKSRTARSDKNTNSCP